MATKCKIQQLCVKFGKNVHRLAVSQCHPVEHTTGIPGTDHCSMGTCYIWVVSQPHPMVVWRHIVTHEPCPSTIVQQHKHGYSQAKHVPTQFYVRVGTHVYMGVVSQVHPEGACEHVFSCRPCPSTISCQSGYTCLYTNWIPVLSPCSLGTCNSTWFVSLCHPMET